MKRNIVLSAFAGLVCLATAAFAVEVYTPNTVGFIRVDLAANQWTLVGVAFDQFDEGVSIADVLGTAGFVDGTRVMVWDTAILDYQISTLFSGSWSGSITLPRGRGFWIRSPVETELFILGQVPQEEQSTLALKEGLQLFTSPYPVPVDMNDEFIFETDPTPGDRVISFEESGYTTSTYFLGTWSGNSVLQPGRGYWYRSVADQNIVVWKPYE